MLVKINHRRWLSRVFAHIPARVFTSALCLVSPLLAAQEDLDLNFLIFEPAAVLLTRDAEDPDAPYMVSTVSESTSTAPADGSASTTIPEPVNLHAWLASRQAQPAETETLEADIARYQSAIRDFELEEGPFSARLPQTLMDQAAAINATGDTDSALALYDRALHIIRVNNGLYSLEQEAVIERIINTHLARGDIHAANAQQEYLFYLHRKSVISEPHSMLLDAIQKFADWNLFAFRAFIGSNPVYNKVSSFNIESAATRSFLDLQTFRAESLLKAQTLIQQMIEIVRQDFGASDPRLIPLQKQLAQSCYLYLSNFSLNENFQITQDPPTYGTSTVQVNSLCSRVGREALGERIALIEENESSTGFRSEAVLDLVDWLIFSKKRMEAQNLLQSTYVALIQDNSLDRETLDALFNPAIPVIVPNFGIGSYSRAAQNIPSDLDLEYKGYIDVEFTLTKYGATRSVNVWGKSADTPEIVETLLVRHLRRAMFRPRIKSETIAEAELVQLRYFYTY